MLVIRIGRWVLPLLWSASISAHSSSPVSTFIIITIINEWIFPWVYSAGVLYCSVLFYSILPHTCHHHHSSLYFGMALPLWRLVSSHISVRRNCSSRSSPHLSNNLVGCCCFSTILFLLTRHLLDLARLGYERNSASAPARKCDSTTILRPHFLVSFSPLWWWWALFSCHHIKCLCVLTITDNVTSPA